MAKWDDHGEEFLRLRAEGRSYAKIGRILPVSVTTLKIWGQREQVRVREMRDAHLVGFVKAFLMEVEERLVLRAEQITRIRDELADRDLGKLSTEQLLRLELRYLESVRRDVAPLKIEVANPLAAYQEVLVQCLHVRGEIEAEDIPGLAAKWEAGPSAGKKALRVDAEAPDEVDQDNTKS